jgi:hypothetical protein
MYSNDRAEALKYTLSCLRDMPLYDKCQRTLVVDTKVDSIPEDWQAVQVPRVGGKFCWGRMWDAGVYAAKHDKIIYLDSDRMLPRSFIQQVDDNLQDDVFIFTSRHFMMLSDLSLPLCKNLLEAEEVEEMLLEKEYMGKFKYEVRFEKPCHGPAKNVMSGSTAFTKRTYIKLGGVDHWYRGHGAFADTDFHMQASLDGCRFLDLQMPELHYHHNKMGDSKIELDEVTLRRMGLDNFIYYCDKWGLPMVLAESLAVRCGVMRPQRYVDKKLKEIKEGAKVS